MASAYEFVLDAVIGFCALLILLNWAGLVSWLNASAKRKTKSRFSFALPFIWGLGGSGAMLLHPRAGVPRLFWLPLILDPSIGFLFVVAGCQRAVRWFQNARKG
jgi:hypothetical protein